MTTEEFQKLRPGERLKDKFGDGRGTVTDKVGPQIALKWDTWEQSTIFDMGDAWMLEALVPKER